MITRTEHIIATPPGETIKEQMETRGIDAKELSKRMGLADTDVILLQLIAGDIPLTPDLAAKLETALGVPASFWNNLEAQYREKLARIERENKTKGRVSQ